MIVLAKIRARQTSSCTISRTLVTRLGYYLHLSTGGPLTKEKNAGFRQNGRPSVDTMFVRVVRYPQELAQKNRTLIHACIIYLMKAYNSINRELLCVRCPTVRSAARLLASIYQLHDSMRVLARWATNVIPLVRCGSGTPSGVPSGAPARNIFLPAMLIVAMNEFSRHNEVLTDMVSVRSEARRAEDRGLSRWTVRSQGSQGAVGYAQHWQADVDHRAHMAVWTIRIGVQDGHCVRTVSKAWRCACFQSMHTHRIE